MQNAPGPPDPSAVYGGPVYTYFMLVKMGRVKGTISDFRDGSLSLSAQGIALQGKAALPVGTRSLVF